MRKRKTRLTYRAQGLLGIGRVPELWPPIWVRAHVPRLKGADARKEHPRLVRRECTKAGESEPLPKLRWQSVAAAARGHDWFPAART